MATTQVTEIELPERTPLYSAGNESVPERPIWITLDLETGRITTDSLPGGYTAEQRPDWTREDRYIELASLPHNIGDLSGVRQMLERINPKELGADAASLERLREELAWRISQAPVRMTYGEAVQYKADEVQALIDAGSIEDYVRYWDAGECVVEAAEIRDGIMAILEEDPYDEEDAELWARGRAVAGI